MECPTCGEKLVYPAGKSTLNHTCQEVADDADTSKPDDDGQPAADAGAKPKAKPKAKAKRRKR